MGGKNIRTRSQTLINDNLLIDFPPDSYYHFLKNNIEADKIKYLLITHSHLDHLYINDFYLHHGDFAHNVRSEKLEIFCSKGAHEQIVHNGVPSNINVTKIAPFKTFSVGGYEVTALPARHMAGDDVVIYMIKDDKTVFYLHDTGFLYEEVFEYIEKWNLF